MLIYQVHGRPKVRCVTTLRRYCLSRMRSIQVPLLAKIESDLKSNSAESLALKDDKRFYK